MLRHVLLLASLLPIAVAAGGHCENDVFRIDARFDGGRLDHCVFAAEDSVELYFRNEDFLVDGAFAWFAFHVSARDSREIAIRMHFPDSHARFWPKLSKDRQQWARAEDDQVEISETGKSMTIRLTVDETGRWVSAQELLTAGYYDAWRMQLDSHFDVDTTVIGESRSGRPVFLASTAEKPEAILLLGRQHPAEVPGAVALRDFVHVVLGTSELARQFRARYMLLIVPLLNPDGVAEGHARHNDGLTDLNRDWGAFTQPETQAVATLLESLESKGIEPRLVLDFHATRQTESMMFYTQMPDDDTDPRQFASRWLGRVSDRIDGFEFDHAAREASQAGNVKNYFFARYGIPAITFEIADELDRDLIHEYTPVFAEEMMRTMLEASVGDN